MTDRRSDPLLDRYLAPQSRSADPLDDALTNDARTRATTAILTNSASPDAIARANVLSRQTGLPPETVDRNLGAAERQVQLQKARNAMQRYPELASWASDPRLAAMSRDDIDSMAAVARSMRTAPKTPIPTLDATMAELRRRQAYWQRATASSGTLTAARPPAPTLWNLIAGVGANLSAMRQGMYQMASDFGNWLVPDSRIGGMPGETREQRIARNQTSARYTMRDTQQAQARVDATTPQFKSQIAAGVYGGVQSFIQQAPGLAASVATANPAPALIWGSGTVGAQSYGKYRGRGATPGEAALGASGEAAVEYVTEKIPMGFLVSAFGKKSAKGFLTEMGKEILTDIPGEQIATLAQDAIDTAIANPDKTWGQYFEERPNAALQTLVATITQGTITGGMGLVGHTIHERGRVAQANADAEFLSELGGLATESKVRTRDPSAFAKFIEMQSQGTPVEKLYIPGEAIASYLQSNDIDWHGEDSPFAFDPSIAGQIDQALATGGDVVIPTSNYVANLAGTEAWDALADHVRGRADGMSLAEARSYEEDYADEMMARGEEAARISREETQRMSPVNRVYQEVFDQARAAGFNVRAARAYAETWASRYEARAARSPELGNAYDAYRASNVSITQEMPESVTRYRKADQMDVVINAMRRGAEAPKPQGRSLLEFIAARGGIEDRGGDIASMGGDKWHTAKAFRRRLIRPHDDGAQGSMLGPRSASGHGVDDVLQAAIDEGYFPELLRTMDIRGGVDTGTYADKPDTAVLLDAIDAELRGSPRYPESMRTDAAAETQAHVAAAAEDLRAMLESQGVDPDKASREEIDAALKAYGMAEDEGDVRGLDQKAKGRIDIHGDGRNIIRLFEGRDLSTLLHESGHLWLEELRSDATAENAPEQIRNDWQVVQDWFAKAGFPVEDGTIPTDAHEMWARGIERYFMEGKAPSSALRAAFEAFKGWLLRIYQVAGNLRTPLTNEVRGVMDRLIATDESITDAQLASEARAMFTSAEQAGMTDAEFAAYQEAVGAARGEAFDALLYRTMETVRRERTAEWKRERRGVRDEVAGQISKRPEFLALARLRSRGEDKVSLDRTALVEMFGEDALKLVPAGAYRVTGGIHPDVLAETVGLSSGQELMSRLMGIQQRENQLREIGDRRSAFNEAVDVETDEIMRERHGDALTDGSIEEEALAAIHNDRRATILASELRQLARRNGTVPTPWRLAKEWAERTVREGRIAEQASAAALAQHRRAEQKAGRAAEKAMLAGDLDEAFNQKQAQMLNHALWRAAKEAKDEVDAIVRRLGKLAKAKTLPSMDQDYLDRIHDLLEDYDFRARTRRDNAERVAFADWVKAKEEAGEEVYIPPRLADATAMNWSRMTYGDLTSLDDVVASIAHLGRRKKKLLVAQEERDFDELVGEAIAGAAAVPDQKVSSDRNPKRSNLRRVHAELVKVESIADSMDDENPNGVFNRVLIRGATDAANKKTELTESVLKPLSALYLDMDKAQRKRLLGKVEVPEFVNHETGEATTFTRMELLAVALNTGNESNLDKMLRGEGWSQASLDTVLARELNEQDWQFVQGVWDRIDTLWPEIARVERELTGVVPEKVEPRAVQTRFGTLRGGYYPLVYDTNHPRANERVRDNAAKDAEQFFGQHGRNVGTPKGHTIQRTDFAGPLLYSVEGVLFNHVNRVTTRIAYGRYIRDALKFTRDGRIRNLVRKKLGQEMLDQIDPWLRRQVNEAAMNTRDIRGWEQALRQFRINATMVGLGFRFTTMQAQVAGLNNSMGLIGPKWVATGMAEWMSKRGEAKQAVFDASPEMARRAEEFDRDVAAAFRQMSGKASRLDGVRAMAYWGIGQIDVHMVAIPTWLGAYRKGLSEGMNETDAAAYGDKIVRITQAAGRAKDLASLQDSGEGWRVATMFYSYFNALYQQQRIAVRSALRGDYRKAAQITFFTMIAAPLMSALLIGDWPDDDEDWGEWALTRVFFGLWAGIPFVRDAASGGQQFVSGKARNLKDALDKADNPVIRATVSLGSLADDFYKGAHDGEMPDKWLRHAIETPGYFVGLPSGQPAATADYLYGIAEGKQRPKDVGEFGYGVMKGRQKDQE